LENKANQVYITTKDFLVTGESFNLIHHPKKEMLVTTPQPKIDELYKYYESEDYISHTDEKKGFVATLYQIVKKYSLTSKVNLIQSLNKGTGTILDIGAGTGEFLKLAKDKNWNVHGVEPNLKARLFSEKKEVLLKERIEDFSNQKFDVVTLWHVLEHLPDLEKVTTQLESFLNPRGILIIAVPNYKSYDATYYKNYWAAYDTPRHLWHFSRKSMNSLFSTKMKLINTKPMWFDSFYVCLLSEKYKTKNAFSIKALLIGLWSNILALKTKEHSSVIYCYKKQP
jgi:2-polyprenyl-3-methyl-5-hydroxy-6-metoxy-1,4-benzoquinol methylase